MIIIGKGFKPNKDFEDYVKSVTMNHFFVPQFIVLHNTASPTFKEWHNVPGEKRMQGLKNYYEGKAWHAGPHLFVADDLIWVFSPLDKGGVHSPSWNHISWGVEMVGDYATEVFNGSKVKENAVFVLAVLSEKGSLDSSTIKFHKEDPLTDHDCPGKNVIKSDIISEVHNLLVKRAKK